MTQDPWIGALFITLGTYFLICSLWQRHFFLYRMKIAQAARVFGERPAHVLYATLGAGFVIFGCLKLLQLR